MKKNLSFGEFLIAILILFVGTSVVSSSYTENIEQYEGRRVTIDGYGSFEQIILFSDDFDDNSKDYSKWAEIFSDGIWDEENQRAEFQLFEPGQGSHNFEGLESTEIIAPLNPASPIIINWDMIVNIQSTNWAGSLFLKVTDGTNWLKAEYSRYLQSTRYRDSNDGGYIVLNDNKPYGTFSNEIQLFSDRYILQMDNDNTGPIYDFLFSLGIPLKIQIYIESAGDQTTLYFRSGFDNVKVSFEEPETKRVFIFGRIENLKETEVFILFDAVKTRVVTFIPFSFDTYISGKTIVIFGTKIGMLSDKFVFGFFNMAT